MAHIQARIDELQKQLIAKQMAEAEKERKKTIVDGSIEQLEEFCNLSDEILDKPSKGAEARAAQKKRYEDMLARGYKVGSRAAAAPPSPGETLKEVFKNRLDPTHELYESYHPPPTHNHNSPEGFNDWFNFKNLKHPPNRRQRGQLPTPVELEVMKNEWVCELENRVYSTTSAGDMYMNQTLKCILGILKKQQQEINWLKSKFSESSPPV